MPGLSTILLVLAVVAFILVALGVGLGTLNLTALGLAFTAGALLADHLGWGVRHDRI